MFDCLPGFRDFYPEDCLRRNFIFSRWSQVAKRFGFQEYDIPTLESLELFTEKSGPEIVSQLFHFTDQGGRSVALRPELTPSLARMIGSKANSLKRPAKWFNIAENFRYERQQKGRLRSHYQFNGDIFGEPGAGADAEVINLCLTTLFSFGLKPTDIRLRLSDRVLWTQFLAALGHEGDSAGAILSVVDRKERMEREAVLKFLEPYFGEASESFLGQLETLTSIRDFDELKRFMLGMAPSGEIKQIITARLEDWEILLDDLNALGLQDYYQIDLGIVRGLAYYTGFVFEVFALDEKGQFTGRALAGGGRYDHLVSKLGYPDMPAVGFGMGDVTLGDLLMEKKLLPPLIDVPDVYMIIGSKTARKAALEDANRLRQLDFRVVYPLKDVGFGKQFKLAGQSGAKWALIYGDEEIAQNSVKVRNLADGEEKLVNRRELERLGEL